MLIFGDRQRQNQSSRQSPQQKKSPWLSGVVANNYLIFIFLGLLLFYSLRLVDRTQKISSAYQFIQPPPFMEYFTFGYRELMADVLWMRAIQDFDSCTNNDKPLLFCEKKWIGQMLLKVSDLAPRFRMVYALGPLILSVMANDVQNSEILIRRSQAYFPNDWPILYRGGYVYLYEVGDKKLAADFFLRAARNGAPQWLYSLSVKLLKETGQSIEPQQLLEEAKQSGIPELILKRMQERILQSPR